MALSLRLVLFMLISWSVLLSGCSSTPNQIEDLYSAPVVEIKTPLPDSIEETLAQLQAMSEPERSQHTLAWSAQYLNQGDTENSLRLINLLDGTELKGQQLAQWTQLKAALLLGQGEALEALNLLQAPALTSIEQQLPVELKAPLGLLRADTFTLNDQLINSLRERVRISTLLSNDDSREYNEKLIWAQMMLLPHSDLVNEGGSTSNPTLKGWLELALIYRDPLSDIDRQVQNLDAWQGRWQNHPASTNMPLIIGALREAAKSRPENIAVLLPFSGPLAPAAQAIQNGMMAAYYRVLNNGHNAPELKFYNSHNTDIIELYNQALADKADLIIGPLDKNQAATLALVPKLPIPTLALNYVDAEKLPKNLYQFGLAPEDEARQVARQAIEEGMLLAAVLAPQNSWGDRLTRAFIEEYNSLGGIVSTSETFKNDPTAATKALMNISQSQARARRIRQLAGQELEFEPRRRQDMDFIFLVGNSGQGRQLKPALNFHYAGDIAVLSTSHIYSGTPAPQRDSDLNHIRFIDMPWLLNAHSDLHRQSRQAWPDGHGRYERLFAMGIDAYHLQARLAMLKALPDSFLPGVTGELTLGDQQNLIRELQWAVFVKGKPMVMPTVSQAPPTETNEPINGIPQATGN